MPWVFNKVPALVLALLCLQGIPIVRYLGNLLLREQSAQALSGNIQWTVQTPQSFDWILNLQMSALELVHHLKYLGLILKTAQSRVFLFFFPQDKLQTFFFPDSDSVVQKLLNSLLLHESSGPNGSLIKAVQFTKFYSRPLQLKILPTWINRYAKHSKTCYSWPGGSGFQLWSQGNSFFHCSGSFSLWMPAWKTGVES